MWCVSVYVTTLSAKAKPEKDPAHYFELNVYANWEVMATSIFY